MSRHLALIALVSACAREELAIPRPDCVPLDGAWAVSLRVTDAATGRPVGNAIASGKSSLGETDSLGWMCLRDLAEKTESLEFTRRGYRDASLRISGNLADVVARDVTLERVLRPCCDLRGQWSISFRLVSRGEGQPEPRSRVVTGAVNLGPRYHAPEVDDDLDSLVHIVRGLHSVDFTPFFGGPVAQDVSTSVFGGGPDLLREVEASVPAGNRVVIAFIPRMTHGSLSLYGRIRGDTIRGKWSVNTAAHCCGTKGRFVMVKTGPVDTVSPPVRSVYQRTLRHGSSVAAVAAGHAPNGSWRPALSVAPNGRVWLAVGGLFVSDSFGSAWRRVLGGDADPVDTDELRIGIHIGFTGDSSVIIGLPQRYLLPNSPLLYRTADNGATWASIRFDGLDVVNAMGVIERSVWVMGMRRGSEAQVLFVSADGGDTWQTTQVPQALQDVTRMHRVSPSIAYVATSGFDGRPALWRTTDGGSHWFALPTPSDQQLQRLEEHDTRIEQIATIGNTLVVREHGRVFASAVDPVRWRPLPGVEAIASEPNGRHLFALVDSLTPALLDRELRVVWRSARPLPRGDIEETVFRGDNGYIIAADGSLYQVRDRTLRVLHPIPDGASNRSVQVLIRQGPR